MYINSNGGGLISLNTYSVGSYSLYTTATANGSDLLIYGRNTSGTAFSIDNVSVKEVIDTNNIPRISYDSNGDNGHILLEPTSTNLITYSEDFSEWDLGSNATLTYESDVVAPDGSLGVYRLTLPATSSTFLLSNTFSGQNPLALSIYAKSASTNNNFNLYDGSNSSSLKTATSEWQRFDYIGNGNQLAIINSGDTFITDIYIWGAQAEALSYATSYIPTLTGSTETRATETATGAGSADLINSTEGVLYAEIAALRQVNDNVQFLAINSSSYTQNSIYIQLRSATNQIAVWAYSNGSNEVAEIITLTDVTAFNKIAIRWKVNDFNVFINGTSVFTDTSYNAPTSSSLNTLEFARGGSLNIYCKCKALAVFNEALSDDELNNLTG